MCFIAALLAGGLLQVPDGVGEIRIANEGFVEREVTDVDAGPAVGNMLNQHFFPGVAAYGGGFYSQAAAEFTYVVERPQYLEGNPRRSEFLSTAHYLRGMIYAYHATGLGRYARAKEDFEAAILSNPGNYPAFLELSRMYSNLGFSEQAASVLHQLLGLEPDEQTAAQARNELELIEPQAERDH